MGSSILFIRRVVADKICFGYLYNWYVVDDSRELTSSADWSVFTSIQKNALRAYLGGVSTVGGLLKETGDVFWINNVGATNTYGFDAKGSGFRSYAGGYTNLRSTTVFMSLDEFSSTEAGGFQLTATSDNWTNRLTDKETGWSIRLVKDATGLADGVTTTYTGNDGKTYSAIVINELYWTTQNLEETKYRNGDVIPNITDDTMWAALTSGALCLYDNNEDYACKLPLPVPIEIVKYGYLYNWYSVIDSKNLANDDWSVPTQADFAILVSYLGGNLVAGGKLKHTIELFWTYDIDGGATNEVAFNAVGSGNRGSSGTFGSMGALCDFKSSDYVDDYVSHTLHLRYDGVEIGTPITFILDYRVLINNGNPVRLVKNSTTLSHGETGTYTGNDGKTYRTICVGTQEWVADNLKETKYRNGDTIPVETDNATWSALTTGARCVYDNDEDNA